MSIRISLLVFLTAINVYAQTSESFWLVTGHDQRIYFWRIVESGNQTSIYDACAEKAAQPSTVAQKTGHWSWESRDQKGILTAHFEQGVLKLSFRSKDIVINPYGTGQRIEPVKCEDGTPVKVRMMDVGTGESSLAAIPPVLSDDTFWQADFFTYDEGRGNLCEDKIDQSKLSVFSSLYWRVEKHDNIIELHNACSDRKQAGKTYLPLPVKEISESLFEIKGIVSNDYGGLFAHLEKDGKLRLTIKGLVYGQDAGGRNVASVKDCLYGTAHRIQPVTCQDNKPIKVEKMVLKTVFERTFAGGDFQHLGKAVGVTLPLKHKPSNPPAPQFASSLQVSATGETFDCRVETELDSQIRPITNMPILGTEPSLWPGALLQGSFFAKGEFKAIDIDRAPGEINIDGIHFLSGSTSKDDVKMNPGDVKKAISELVSQETSSVEAQVESPETMILYNNDQMGFRLRADGRFTHDLRKHFNVDTTRGMNYVLYVYRRTSFNASLESPENSWSVFANGKSLKDPQNEIGASNPPLLVNNVSYGRAIYILVASPYQPNAVVAALEGASQGRPDGTITAVKWNHDPFQGIIAVRKKATYNEILQESNFSFFAQGLPLAQTLMISGADRIFGNILGNEYGKLFRYFNSPEGQNAKKVLDDINHSSKYDAVKKLLAFITSMKTDLRSAAPIKYSASYLASDLRPAQMGFAAAYYRPICTVTPKNYSSFTLEIFHIDDRAEVSLLDPASGRLIAKVFQESWSLPQSPLVLDDFIPDDWKDRDIILSLRLYNVAGPSGLNFSLTRTEFTPKPHYTALNQNGVMEAVTMKHTTPIVRTGGSWHVGWIVDYRIKLNRREGKVEVIQK